MEIGIIGSGRVGGTLGVAFAKQDHDVFFSSRRPEGARIKSLVAEAGEAARSGTVLEAAQASTLLVLATPWQATREALQAAGELDGKVIVDCTNPIGAGLSHALAEGSGAELIAEWAPGACVFKAFNTTGFETMADPDYAGGRPLMLVAGDHGEKKPLVMELAESIGFEAVDLGPLAEARLLESLALTWIKLAHVQGHGRNIAFSLLRRP